MGQLIWCNVCRKTTAERDLRYISIEDKDGKPKMHNEEVCPECALAVKLYIVKLKENHATVSHDS